MIQSNALYIEAFPSSELLSGAERLIRHLVAHDIPIGIATGSSHELYTLKTSNHRELFKLFDPVICTESNELRLSKPAPDIFLACAAKFPKCEKNNYLNNTVLFLCFNYNKVYEMNLRTFASTELDNIRMLSE